MFRKWQELPGKVEVHRCELCGQPVLLIGTDEGTNIYAKLIKTALENAVVEANMMDRQRRTATFAKHPIWWFNRWLGMAHDAFLKETA